MVTDEAGNYYDPAEVTAGPGDVLRLVLVSGVHNFHIPGETNPGADDLPEPGPLLQLPGQTWDWSVDLDPGEYAFQCDPHAALGMIGTLSVTN
jgi:plastocyanin